MSAAMPRLYHAPGDHGNRSGHHRLAQRRAGEGLRRALTAAEAALFKARPRAVRLGHRTVFVSCHGAIGTQLSILRSPIRRRVTASHSFKRKTDARSSLLGDDCARDPVSSLIGSSLELRQHATVGLGRPRSWIGGATSCLVMHAAAICSYLATPFTAKVAMQKRKWSPALTDASDRLPPTPA